MDVTRLLLAASIALPGAARAGDAPSPVLVELFTSHGCSSCPPADELLRTRGKSGWERGELVPLSFHVDYWDYIGWTDPFGSPDWTARQRRYSRTLERRVYTPQMVAGGVASFVGS